MTEQFQPGPRSPAGQPGELGPRFFARLIDFVLLGVVGTATGAVIGFGNGWLILQSLITYGYFVGLDTTQGATLGKRLLGLQVIGPSGVMPTGSQAATREAWVLLGVIPYLGGFLSLGAAILIAVSINASPTKQGRHDDLAGGTQVLRT